MSSDPRSFNMYGDMVGSLFNDPNSISNKTFERIQTASDQLEEESSYENNLENRSNFAVAENEERERLKQSNDDENLYGFIPGDWLPDWVKAGYNNSIQGMAQQLATGKPQFDLSEYNEEGKHGLLEDIGATLVSFLQPVDIAAMAAGGGVGGLTLKAGMKEGVKLAIKEGLKQKTKKKIITNALDDKIVNLIAGAEAKKATNLMVQAGVKKKVAKKVVKKATPRVVHRALAEGVTGATGLGFYSGLATGMNTKIQTGDVDFVTSLKEASKGAILGGLTAGTNVVASSVIGSSLKGGTKELALKAIETGEFGTLSPVLSGESPSLESYAHAAGVIGGLKAQRYAIGQLKKGVGTIKKAKNESLFSSEEAARATLESGRDRIEASEIYTNKDGKKFNNLRFDSNNKTVLMKEVGSKKDTKMSFDDFNSGVFKRRGTTKNEKYLKNRRIGQIWKIKESLNLSLDDFRDRVNQFKFGEEKANLKTKKSTGLSDLNRVEQLQLLNNLRHESRVSSLKKELDKAGWEGHLLTNRGWFDNILPSMPRFWRRLEKRGYSQFSKLAHKDYNKFDSRELTLLGEVIQMFHSQGLHKNGLFKKEKLKKEYENLSDRIENPKNSKDPDVINFRKILDFMWGKMEKAGVDLGPKEQFYFPHMIKPEYLKIFLKDISKLKEANYDPTLLKSPSFQKTLTEMITNGSFDKATVQALENLAGVTRGDKGYSSRIANAYAQLSGITTSQMHNEAKNFEIARTGSKIPKEFLERDARIVLTKYAKQWARRIAYVETFGKKGEVHYDRISAINKLLGKSGLSDIQKIKLNEEKRLLGMSFESLTNKIEMNTEYNWKTPNAKLFWGDLVNFEIGTKIGLGFATLPNMTQLTVSTALRTGYMPMFRGLYKLSRPGAEGDKYRAEIKKSGASMLSVFQMMAGLEPVDSRMGRFAEFTTKWSGFQLINSFNQLVSAATAREHIAELQLRAQGKKRGVGVDRLAIKRLKDYGITDHNIDFNSKAGDRVMRESMYKFARDAQLQRNILQEPAAFNDPRWRPFFLFKKFGYKQFNFVKDELRKEASRGNFYPMLRLGVSGMVGGEMILWSRDKLSEWISGGQIYDENEYMFPFLRPDTPMGQGMYNEGLIDMSKFKFSDFLDRFGAIGAMGMITDILANENKIRAIEFIAKPAIIQDMDKVWTAMTETWKGMGDYGGLGSVVRLPKYIGPMLGTIPRRGVERFSKKFAPAQRETGIKYRKGLTTTKVIDHLLEGNSDMAIRIVKSWNRTYGMENPITSRNINPNAIRRRIKSKYIKSIKP